MSWWMAGGRSASRLLWACCSTHGVRVTGVWVSLGCAPAVGLLDHVVCCCFYSDCANSHSHPACASTPSPHLCCHLPFCVFPMTMTDILTCVRSWLIVVLICFPNTKGVFFFFNRGTCWSFTWEYCPFSNWIFIAIKLFDSLYILGINPHRMHNWLVLSLHLQNDLVTLPLWQRSFLVQHNPICLFSILFSVLLGSSAKRLCWTNILKFLLYVSPSNFIFRQG